MQYEVRRLDTGYYIVVFLPTGQTVSTMPTLRLAQNTAKELAARYGAKQNPKCRSCGEYLIDCPCQGN